MTTNATAGSRPPTLHDWQLKEINTRLPFVTLLLSLIMHFLLENCTLLGAAA